MYLFRIQGITTQALKLAAKSRQGLMAIWEQAGLASLLADADLTSFAVSDYQEPGGRSGVLLRPFHGDYDTPQPLSMEGMQWVSLSSQTSFGWEPTANSLVELQRQRPQPGYGGFSVKLANGMEAVIPVARRPRLAAQYWGPGNLADVWSMDAEGNVQKRIHARWEGLFARLGPVCDFYYAPLFGQNEAQQETFGEDAPPVPALTDRERMELAVELLAVNYWLNLPIINAMGLLGAISIENILLAAIDFRTIEEVLGDTKKNSDEPNTSPADATPPVA